MGAAKNGGGAVVSTTIAEDEKKDDSFSFSASAEEEQQGSKSAATTTEKQRRKKNHHEGATKASASASASAVAAKATTTATIKSKSVAWNLEGGGKEEEEANDKNKDPNNEKKNGVVVKQQKQQREQPADGTTAKHRDGRGVDDDDDTNNDYQHENNNNKDHVVDDDDNDDDDDNNSNASWIPEEEDEDEDEDECHSPSDAAAGRLGSNAVTTTNTTATTTTSMVAPVVCLSHGLSRKASATALRSWVAVALTLDGRDKLTKVCQYSARLLSWWFAAVRRDPNQAARFAAVKASLTVSRKAFRLGRSLIEMHRISNLGLWETLRWHYFRQQHQEQEQQQQATLPSPPEATATTTTTTRTPVVTFSTDLHSQEQKKSNRSSLLRSADSNVSWTTVSRMYYSRRLVSSLSNVTEQQQLRQKQQQAATVNKERHPPLWKLVGSALKMVGLFGFWGADNTNYLAGSGLFDDYGLPPEERAVRRQALQSRASKFGNRCYFAGAVAGLITSLRSYWAFRKNTLTPLHHRRRQQLESSQKRRRQRRQQQQGDDQNDRDQKNNAAEDDDEEEDYCDEQEEREDAEEEELYEKACREQFSLLLQVLKGCCDVLVFSNNPGIDLWKRYNKGRKMHEGFHCLCGLLSASTVLYANFPNAAVAKKPPALTNEQQRPLLLQSRNKN